MFIEVTLPNPIELSAVRVEATLDQKEGAARLEAEVNGRWSVLAERPVVSQAVPLQNLRREAIVDMKREGITHLSVQKSEYFANDMAEDPTRWGISLLGESENTRIYRLD
jgi:hypothetical protein